ncbi:hypothetical protein N9E90_04740, partial [Akkermansiaceae bacterium]|nr:hypothetical protein [Akkermansiaceae bacterium]
KRCAFRPDRLTGSSLFKIPELVKSRILVSQGWSGLECESFIDAYKEEGFTGLLFEEIWRAE